MRQTVIGSLGPPLNHLAIAEERSTGVDALYEHPWVVVTTADGAIEERVVAALVASGIDPAIIHHDRIPHALVRMGLHEEADTVSVVFRIAVPEDSTAAAAYRQDPGATLLRLTPDGAEHVTDPHPVPVIPTRGRIFFPVASEISATAIVIPALGPSLRIAPAGM